MNFPLPSLTFHPQASCWCASWVGSCNSVSYCLLQQEPRCLAWAHCHVVLVLQVSGPWEEVGIGSKEDTHLPPQNTCPSDISGISRVCVWEGVFRLRQKGRSCSSQPRGFREIWEFRVLRLITLNVSMPDLRAPLFSYWSTDFGIRDLLKLSIVSLYLCYT